jgi:hypothetical protein
MYCPKCKAEYREGFTRCADCEVELVDALPEAGEGALKSMPRGPLVPLWEGENLALHSSLLQELEAAGIRYFDEPMSVYPGARRAVPFPIVPMVKFGYQVAVISSDLAASKEILEKLVKEVPQDMALPLQDETQVEAVTRIESSAELANCEIWIGDDKRLAGFIEDALRENEMVMRPVMDEGKIRIYVRQSEESRAREIVREIEEGAPPE